MFILLFTSLLFPLLGKVNSQQCFCNLIHNRCEVDCCCDLDCTENNTQVFSTCTGISVNSSEFLCSSFDVVFVNNILTTVQITNNDLFCVVRDNFEERNFFSEPSCAVLNPTTCIDSKTTYSYVPTSSTVADQNFYQSGDAINVRFAGSSSEGFFKIPSSGMSKACQNYNAVSYLVASSSSCTRSARNLSNTCNTWLNYETYMQEFQICSTPLSDCLVNISLSTCIVNEVEGSCQPSSFDGRSTCNFAVTSVSYIIQVNASGIVSANVSFILRDVTFVDFPLSQSYSVDFKVQSNNVTEIARGGNPGYIVRRPLLTAVRKRNGDVVSEILQNSALGFQISLINPSNSGSCADALAEARLPVLFGISKRTGCQLNVVNDCSALNNEIRNVLDGITFSAFNGTGEVFVGTYGNSSIDNLLLVQAADWVQVVVTAYPTLTNTDTSGCNVVLNSKYEILYANSGGLNNPQPKIIGVRYSYGATEFLTFRCSGGTCNQKVEVFTSVDFIDISTDPTSLERRRPVIYAALPHNFFFPLKN